MLPEGAIGSRLGSGNRSLSGEFAGWAKRSVPTLPVGGKMVGTALARLCPPYDPRSLSPRNDGEDTGRRRHFPVFTLVQSRLMMRWVAGSRAWMTNSFFCVA